MRVEVSAHYRAEIVGQNLIPLRWRAVRGSRRVRRRGALFDKTPGVRLDNGGIRQHLLNAVFGKLGLDELDEPASCHRVQLDAAPAQKLDLLVGGAMPPQGCRASIPIRDGHALALQIHSRHVDEPQPDIDQRHLIHVGVPPAIAGERTEDRESGNIEMVPDEHPVDLWGYRSSSRRAAVVDMP